MLKTPRAGSPHGAHAWIEKLNAHLATAEGDSQVDRVVSGLTAAVERTITEHRGMASELLCVYEQLGVVFEVTRKLAGVGRETEVVDLFLESIRRTFCTHEVFAVLPNRKGGWTVDGSNLPISEWLGVLAGRARNQARVLVEPPPPQAISSRVEEVMVGPVRSGDSFVCAIILARKTQTPEFTASDMLLLESLTMFCGDLIRNHRLVRELQDMSFALVRSLVSAVDQKDQYTSGHSLRVGYYATLLGRELGQGREDLQMLQWSALLHDVGKIGIRDDVLNKPGKLAADEFSHIKEHPVRSYEVVREVRQLAAALDGILHHHEHYDGKGYPGELKGEAIPLQARIIQVADVFDALTSTRSYRQAHHWNKALAILQEEAGRTVDPHIQKVFDGLMRRILSGPSGAWEELVQAAEQCPQVAAESEDRRKE